MYSTDAIWGHITMLNNHFVATPYDADLTGRVDFCWNEINDTTDYPKWANYLDLRLEFDEDGKLYIRLYDRRDDFDFPMVNFPYLSRNILESPAYGVFVSQLIRHARACSKYEDFLFSGSILVSMLLKQGYSSRKLQTAFRKFYGRHTDPVHNLLTLLCHMLNGLFTNCDI